MDKRVQQEKMCILQEAEASAHQSHGVPLAAEATPTYSGGGSAEDQGPKTGARLSERKNGDDNAYDGDDSIPCSIRKGRRQP